MSDYVEVPLERVPTESLQALLEEYASRDGTDYGERETPLEIRVTQLLDQLRLRELRLLYSVPEESWDLVDRETAQELLSRESAADEPAD